MIKYRSLSCTENEYWQTHQYAGHMDLKYHSAYISII